MSENKKGTCAEETSSIQSLLSASSQQALKNILKRGIYKELHKRELLSDGQLADLLSGCQRQE